MSEAQAPAEPEPTRPAEPAFERDAVPVRGALFAAAGLLGGIAVSALLVWALFRVLDRVDPVAPVPPLAAQALQPPGPPLETTALGERPLLDARAALELSRSRWLDAARSRAQLPIARAMELLAERGWPDTEAAP